MHGSADVGGSCEKQVIAIAHDYLTQRGGAERVVLAMHRAFPTARIYTTLYDPDGTYPEFKDAEVVTSPLNRIPFLRRHHRVALPLLAVAARMLDVKADIVIASSTGWAHGFRTRGRVLVYCHSPARWLYLTEQYLGGPAWRSPVGLALSVLKPFLRSWDQRAAHRASRYVANSTVVRRRVQEVYGRESEILHPPHSVDISDAVEPIAGLEEFISDGGHFLLVSRLLPYKNVEQAVDAFRGLHERLLIIGAGPLADRLRRDCPENVRIASHVPDEQMRWAYSSCTAVLAPSHEDFGITPLEGGAWGKPTLALRAGGYLDTIAEGETGAFFDEPTAERIREAVVAFQPGEWDAAAIRAHVERFSEQGFRQRLRHYVRDMAAP